MKFNITKLLKFHQEKNIDLFSIKHSSTLLFTSDSLKFSILNF